MFPIRKFRGLEFSENINMDINQHKTQIVQVVEYDPNWPLIFEEIKQVIEIQLGVLAVTVEHVGSTAVPGLTAKPIVDLDIVIGSEVDLPSVILLLSELGYVHLGDLGIDGREAFGRLTSEVPRLSKPRQWFPHNLYVCTKDSRELRRHIGFREYLRGNPSEASKYGDLKRQLALRYRYDIDGYVEGKSTFIEGALSRIST